MGVLDVAGIQLVSLINSNDKESPEPTEPNSGNTRLIDTIDLFTIAEEDFVMVSIDGLVSFLKGELKACTG